jgi:hypothetical protein
MKKRYKTCSKITNNKKVSLEENKSKIVFHNQSQKDLELVKVDGCLITDGLRCDYLIIEDNNFEHFVELKGCDVSHAIKQLTASFKLSVCSKTHEKKAYIVSSRCPVSSPEIQILKLKFKKDFNALLSIKNTHCTVSI